MTKRYGVDRARVTGMEDSGDVTARSTWTFMTNHAQVLLCIARDPSIRLREVAASVGITERSAQSIVTELVEDGYLVRSRVGRRNQYRIHSDAALRPHQHLTVGALLDFLQSSPRPRPYRQRSQASAN